MEISFEVLIELLLQVASAKGDSTAEHVLMAVKRMRAVHLSESAVESILGSVADGLGVPLV